MSNRWLVVDPGELLILDGPFLWDGETPWQAPGLGISAADAVASGQLRLEAEALAAGYHRPPPPEEEWVGADPNTMTITGGPVMWNGQGSPPLAAEIMLRRVDAEANGYTWP